MKKLLLVFIILIITSGCSKKNDLYMEYLDNFYKLIPVFKNDCENESEQYFKYINKTFYLVCADDVILEKVDSDSLDLENLKDYFDLLDSANIINVFLNTSATQDNVLAIKKEIDNYDNVLSTTIKSKQEWQYELSQDSESLNTIINNLDENPFSDSIVVKVKGLNYIENIVQNLKNIELVDEVSYSKLLTSQNDDFIDNLVTHNKVKTKEINQATLYEFNNLSVITCKDNIYIGPNGLKDYDYFCK